jgi:hypothetical protein
LLIVNTPLQFYRKALFLNRTSLLIDITPLLVSNTSSLVDWTPLSPSKTPCLPSRQPCQTGGKAGEAGMPPQTIFTSLFPDAVNPLQLFGIEIFEIPVVTHPLFSRRNGCGLVKKYVEINPSHKLYLCYIVLLGKMLIKLLVTC